MKGLYIHIPFCIKKCRYCDFTSFADQADCFDAYTEAVINEMKEYGGESIDTVFIGGGTPTVLSSAQLERIIKAVFERFNVSGDYEFTVEANPGTLDDEKIKMLLSGGVNRMSIGVQSFNDDDLKALGRIHSAKTAYNTICRLYELGFLNINADIMTALPSQTEEGLLKTVEYLLELPLTHISAYSLIIEDGTPIAEDYKNGLLTLPDEDSDRNMYAALVKMLAKNGFERYEISNFAKDGFECRHNIKYWQCNEYIGLGAAAHSYIKSERFSNTPDLAKYLKGEYGRTGETLTEADKISEFIFMGLRMRCGISEKEFKRRFNIGFCEAYKKQLEKFIGGGFMKKENGFYRFTAKGADVSNSILCEFI